MSSNWISPTFEVLVSVKIVVALISLFLITGKSHAFCYFSPELQGFFITQGTISENQIQYNQINITEDSIPIWGVCHKRIDNNVILMISSEETTCFRCFNLKLVSRNILRVCTTDPEYISKCYTNEEKALASCPSDNELADNSKYTEIILYKSLEMNGHEIRKEYCPINGRYRINYNNDDGEEDFVECSTLDSELDNCPSSSTMNLRFKKCSFENHEITFECLGHWEGLNKQKYLALRNAHSSKDKLGPQYRCAIYKENLHTGIINIWFSRDSSCSAINTSMNSSNNETKMSRSSSSSHLETLTLYPNESNIWPLNNFCQFPQWMQGHWEYISVKNDTLVFRDQTSLKAYTMKCVENHIQDYILVYSRTQCGEEAYQCLKIKNRSPNILEMQIGTQLSHSYTHTICSEEHFDDTRWLTQGRLDHNYMYSPCPVSGEFTGMIPDAPNFCAKLSSECLTEDVMFYEVSSCDDGEIYEERKYRCLGQWEERGFVYTYTKRLDVGTYECFVGSMTTEEQVFIKEAGEHCQRNVDPYRYGMELKKIDYCKKLPVKPVHATQRHQKSSVTSSLPETTTMKSLSTKKYMENVTYESSSLPSPSLNDDSRELGMNGRTEIINAAIPVVTATSAVVFLFSFVVSASL